jgi:hypothetical protein
LRATLKIHEFMYHRLIGENCAESPKYLQATAWWC